MEEIKAIYMAILNFWKDIVSVHLNFNLMEHTFQGPFIKYKNPI